MTRVMPASSQASIAGAIANAAAQLNGKIDRGADFLDRIGVRAAAFESAVEIDAMQPLETRHPRTRAPVRRDRC